MPILLATDPAALLQHATSLTQTGLRVLLTLPGRSLAEPPTAALDDLLVIDISGPRMQRLNFDVVSLAVVDLEPEVLLAPGGRRLVEALAYLAQEQLSLAFVGPAVGVTGMHLADRAQSGLNLLPRTAVVPNVQAIPHLRHFLEQLSEAGLRLLALDGAVSAHYRHEDDSVEIRGSGSALLVAFSTQHAPTPTARLHVLTAGMRRTWPTD